MIGPYQNVLFFSLCQSLSTCNSFSFSPPLDFGALALGRSWLSWGSLSMENRGKLILWFETTRQWWSQWWSMKNWQKNHRNSPHLEEVHVSTPKSWTFITSAPKSLTNWVKVYQSSATFTCRPDVHSKILSPGQNEKNMWGHQDHCWCQHQEQAYVIQIQIQSLCLERVWNGVLSVFFVFLGQNPGQYSSNPFQTFLVGIFT